MTEISQKKVDDAGSIPGGVTGATTRPASASDAGTEHCSVQNTSAVPPFVPSAGPPAGVRVGGLPSTDGSPRLSAGELLVRLDADASGWWAMLWNARDLRQEWCGGPYGGEGEAHIAAEIERRMRCAQGGPHRALVELGGVRGWNDAIQKALHMVTATVADSLAEWTHLIETRGLDTRAMMAALDLHRSDMLAVYDAINALRKVAT
jgi:hypothetical protein